MMERLRRAFRQRFRSHDVPDFDDDELTLEDEKLDQLVKDHVDDEMKTDEEMEIPSFDYHPRDGLLLN